MSKGDINLFLAALFQSEGGAQPDVINTYGYIGKYQFGEDALADLGYYKPDGTNNRTVSGKFKYDWVGEWTGKNGVTSRDVFLHDVTKQDQAAKEWVKLLCSRAKKFKLQQYIGHSINGIDISESGIIAAAHLRGFGSSKSPGVRQFLSSEGNIDPTDANGTPVSKYMRIFADYDLGCCGSVAAVLIDKDKKPITGLGYQLKVGNRVAANGKTDANGATKNLKGLDAGALITILVEKMEGGFKEIKTFLSRETALVATLRSPTRMVDTKLEKHTGTPGGYKRHSESAKPQAKSTSQLSGNKTATSSSPAAQTAPQARDTAPQASAKTNNTEGLTADSSGASMVSDAASSAEPEKPYSNDLDNTPAATVEPDGDGGESISRPSDTPMLVEVVRNEDGHPVAVAQPDDPAPTDINPDVQKLDEILRRNAGYGLKTETLSGLVAAEKSKKGEPISTHQKKEDSSIGRCYKYVKIALLASGMTKHYLAKEAAKDAGPELQKEGFHNLLDNPNHGLKSPYDAPLGAVIVYDVTDGSPWGHIEVRVNNGFASDYVSLRPRTVFFGKEAEASMVGRNRKVSGIWVKSY